MDVEARHWLRHPQDGTIRIIDFDTSRLMGGESGVISYRMEGAQAGGIPTPLEGGEGGVKSTSRSRPQKSRLQGGSGERRIRIESGDDESGWDLLVAGEMERVRDLLRL